MQNILTKKITSKKTIKATLIAVGMEIGFILFGGVVLLSFYLGDKYIYHIFYTEIFQEPVWYMFLSLTFIITSLLGILFVFKVKKIKTNNKSFTLIELLVVIAIIGVIAAIVVINLSGGTDKARIAKGQAFSAKIGIELADSVVSKWNFDEATGTTAKDAWGENSGTLSDSSMWRSGGDCVSGNCLYFDGTNDYVDCGTDAGSFAMGNGDYTLEAWIYPTTTVSAYDYVVAIGNNAAGKQSGLGIWEGNVLFLSAYSSPIVKTTYALPSLNKWYHFVMSYNGTTDIASFYINGEWKEDESITIDTTVGKCRIGAHVGDVISWNGLIDEVYIYNNAASIAQIQSQYLVGLDRLLYKEAISKSEYNQRIKKLSIDR